VHDQSARSAGWQFCAFAADTVRRPLGGATVIGNTGSFIRDVASAWLTTDLSPSPAAVALVQAAATLPVVLLAIPAGVLADSAGTGRLFLALERSERQLYRVR
jgi:MFS family permease